MLNGHSQNAVGNIRDIMSNYTVFTIINQMLEDYVKSVYELGSKEKL